MVEEQRANGKSEDKVDARHIHTYIYIDRYLWVLGPVDTVILEYCNCVLSC